MKYKVIEYNSDMREEQTGTCDLCFGTAKIKAYLGQFLGRYYINNEELTPRFTRSQFTGKGEIPTFTRKELEQAGFGWVFDCEGIEIEEVEE